MNKRQVINQVLLNTLQSLPFVIKEMTLKFSVYWFPIAYYLIYIFADNSFFLQSEIDSTAQVTLIEKCFTIFLTSYFLYKYLLKYQFEKLTYPEVWSSNFPFWPFVRKVVNPWLWNQIKAIFFVSLYFFFLIIPGFLYMLMPDLPMSLFIFLGCLAFIPGIIKIIHFIFITPVTFFDEDYRIKKISALEVSKNLVKGNMFLVIILIIVIPVAFFVTQEAISFFLNSLFQFDQMENVFRLMFGFAGYTISFYLGIIQSVFALQGYFVIKRLKSKI